jgi:hypothetical protein
LDPHPFIAVIRDRLFVGDVVQMLPPLALELLEQPILIVPQSLIPLGDFLVGGRQADAEQPDVLEGAACGVRASRCTPAGAAHPALDRAR